MRQLNHLPNSLGLANGRIQWLACFGIFFLTFIIGAGMQSINAQTPSDLGPETVEQVNNAFDAEISDAMQAAKSQNDRDLKMYGKYLSKVQDEFNDGADLGETLIDYINTEGGSSTSLGASPKQQFQLDLSDMDAKTFRQDARNMNLSSNDVSDLTDLFDFLISNI